MEVEKKWPPRILQPANQYRHHFDMKNMKDVLSTKEIINLATLDIPRAMKKCNSAAIVNSLQSLIRNDCLTSENHNAKTVFIDIATVDRAFKH